MIALDEMKRFRLFVDYLSSKITQFLTFVSLTLIYFLGIGLSAIFIHSWQRDSASSQKRSDWQRVDYKTDLSKMF